MVVLTHDFYYLNDLAEERLTAIISILKNSGYEFAMLDAYYDN